VNGCAPGALHEGPKVAMIQQPWQWAGCLGSCDSDALKGRPSVWRVRPWRCGIIELRPFRALRVQGSSSRGVTPGW